MDACFLGRISFGMAQLEYNHFSDIARYKILCHAYFRTEMIIPTPSMARSTYTHAAMYELAPTDRQHACHRRKIYFACYACRTQRTTINGHRLAEKQWKEVSIRMLYVPAGI